MDKIIQIAKSIQSFPSIGTLSTSSTGKYSGIGTGSVRRGKIRRQKELNFQFSMTTMRRIRRRIKNSI